MTTYTFPTLTEITRPATLEWSLESNTQVFLSPLNKSVQTMELPGARWRASFTFSDLKEVDAADLQAFLAKLRGQANRFYLWNFARETPRGTATGTPLVKGASQTGATLLTDGWTAGVTGILKAGDFIGFNGELRMVIADCNSDGSGNATVLLDCPMRSSPADNAAITTNKPTCTMMLSESSVRWVTRSPTLTDITIDCVEMF